MFLVLLYHLLTPKYKASINLPVFVCISVATWIVRSMNYIGVNVAQFKANDFEDYARGKLYISRTPWH